MNRNRLYLLLCTLLFAGYIYLAWNMQAVDHSHSTMCLFKNATGIACPSCGTTRSVILLINGDPTNALLVNPLGFVIAALMLLLPTWLIFDLSTGRDTLYIQYRKFETALQTKWIAVTFTILILSNWLWNILKAL